MTLPNWLTVRKIASEQLMLIAAHHVDGTDPIALIKSRPFIRFNRDAVVGAQIEHWIQSHDLRVTEAMELDTLDAIAAMVHADIGVSIVPRPCVMPVNPLPLRWLPLSGTEPTRDLGLAHHTDTAKAPVIEAVLASFENAVSTGAQA